MDFKRIEWIFFLVFLGLNIFLFGIYQESTQDESNVNNSSQTESIEKRLEKDNIVYDGKLASDKLSGYYLSAEQTNFRENLVDENGNVLKDQLKSRIEYIDNGIIGYPDKNFFIDEKETKDPSKIQETVKAFLKEKSVVLFGEEYQYLNNFSSLSGEFPELSIGQVYKGIPFKDDTAAMTISLEKSEDLLKLNKYSQTHIESIEELRDKMDLYSQKDAVETLYINNRIPGNSSITFIKLAYSRIYKIREKNVYVPVWFIGISSSENSLQIEHVNAMSNTIITNNTVPKVENH